MIFIANLHVLIKNVSVFDFKNLVNDLQHRCIRENVIRIACDESSMTLFYVRNKDGLYWLEALSSVNCMDKFRLCLGPPNFFEPGHMVACDSRVLIHNTHILTNSATLDMYQEITEKAAAASDAEGYRLQFKGQIHLAHKIDKRFSCTYDRKSDEVFVAFTHEQTVYLHRLVESQLEILSTSEFTNPRNVLFQGGMLLVADKNSLLLEKISKQLTWHIILVVKRRTTLSARDAG